MRYAAYVDGIDTETAWAGNGPRTQAIFVGHAPADEPDAVVVDLREARRRGGTVVRHSVFQQDRQIKKKP